MLNLLIFLSVCFIIFAILNYPKWSYKYMSEHPVPGTTEEDTCVCCGNKTAGKCGDVVVCFDCYKSGKAIKHV